MSSLDPRFLTSIGLGMDIVGIVLLFFCGGIGGQWMSQPGVVNWPGIGATEGEIARDERWA